MSQLAPALTPKAAKVMENQYNLSERQLENAFGEREQIPVLCKTSLVIEFYSR